MMEIKIEKYYNIRSIKKIWQKLYQANPKLTPFQDYAYVKNLFLTKLLSLRRGLCPVFYVLSIKQENGYKPILIAPLISSITKQKQHGYTILGAGDCDITDFIYSDSLTVEQLKICLHKLQEKLKSPLLFENVLESSKLTQATQELYPDLELKKSIAVKIPPQSNIDEYIASLSKSTKQNIRTAYNRMNRDELKFELEVAYPSKQNLKLFDEAMDNYIDRQIEYGFPLISGRKSLTKLYFKKARHETLSLKKMTNSFTSVLRFNGEIAGVIMGYIHELEQSIIIPRLAINTKFNFYSPGSVLIVETMRYILANTNLRVIDLAAGNEVYKYKMGGEEYYTCNIVLPKI